MDNTQSILPLNPILPSSMYCESVHSFYDEEESILSGLDPIQVPSRIEDNLAEVTQELKIFKK